MQHIVLRHLYAGHKAQYAVFEDQHQCRGEGSKTCKQCRGRLVDQYRHGKNHEDYPCKTDGYIANTFYRQVAAVLVGIVVIEYEIYHGAESYPQRHQRIDSGKSFYYVEKTAAAGECYRNHSKKDKRRNDMRAFGECTQL